MRYTYFPKILKDLENIEQYNELLPDGFYFMDTLSHQAKTRGVTDVYYSSWYTHSLSSVHGKYIRHCVAPVGSDIKEYAEANDTIFYIYGSSKDCSLTQNILDFLIHIIEGALMWRGGTSFSARGYVVLALLKHLIKDYESEDAFRKDILDNYHFELPEGFFAFIGINSNLDDLDGLAKSLYAPTKPSKYWHIYNFYSYKLLSVLNEIDFWVDSADYNRLNAYEYLLRDDFTHNNKQFSALQNNAKIVEILQRRDEVRKHIVKAKQLFSQGRKIDVRLDDLSLKNIQPKNVKLHLQW